MTRESQVERAHRDRVEAEGGRLLVAGDAGDAQRRAEQVRIGLAELAARRHHIGQDRPRNVEKIQQLRVPLQRVDVEQQRARGVDGGLHFSSGGVNLAVQVKLQADAG